MCLLVSTLWILQYNASEPKSTAPFSDAHVAAAIAAFVPRPIGVAPLRDRPRAAPLPSERARAAIRSAIVKYGCGACGPRGFFGTFDVHLALERALASRHWAGLVDTAAIVYSCAYLAEMSIVGTLCGKGDTVVALSRRQSIVDGASLARASYCDATRDSAHILSARDGSKIVVAVCASDFIRPAMTTCLDALRERLASAAHATITVVVLLIEPSSAEGNWRPVIEALECRAMHASLIRVGALDGTLGMGGYSSGPLALIERQRLGGVGYCFSAALPPYAAAGALAELDTHFIPAAEIEK